MKDPIHLVHHLRMQLLAWAVCEQMMWNHLISKYVDVISKIKRTIIFISDNQFNRKLFKLNLSVMYYLWSH